MHEGHGCVEDDEDDADELLLDELLEPVRGGYAPPPPSPGAPGAPGLPGAPGPDVPGDPGPPTPVPDVPGSGLGTTMMTGGPGPPPPPPGPLPPPPPGGNAGVVGELPSKYADGPEPPIPSPKSAGTNLREPDRTSTCESRCRSIASVGWKNATHCRMTSAPATVV